jgi:hypothetical protein
MAHFPVNHPLRPLYRTLAGLVGLYVLVFGILGVLETWGEPLFARENTWVLGLRTNLAFSLMSVVFGAIIIVGSFTGGNIGHYMTLTIGVIFLVAGLAMMAVLNTDLNLLNFSMATVIVSLLFGLLFLTTGMYDKVSPGEDVGTQGGARRKAAVRKG